MQFKINKTIIEHLINKDERFNRLVNDLGAIELSESNDAFQSLLKSVIFQQLNGKAARTIYHRFLGLYQTIPSPKDVLSTESKILRDVGLSNRKCEYVRDISFNKQFDPVENVSIYIDPIPFWMNFSINNTKIDIELNA